MQASRRLLLLFGVAVAAAGPTPAAAQQAAAERASPSIPLTTLVEIGSPAEDRFRIAQLRGEASPAGFLQRTPLQLSPELAPDSARGLHWALIAPELHYVSNSRLPFSPNEDGLWAGRGDNLQITAGVRLEYGPVTLVFAPRRRSSQNAPIQIYRSEDAAHSAFASPWHAGAMSADLPLRFGHLPLASVDLGQSALRVATGPVGFGLSNQSQWWGPGVRNAIVLSNNAPGIPHAFVETERPLRTRFGEIEARWIAGALTESLFFDTIRGNDIRSLSGVIATLRPALEPDLTLGVSHVVYANVDGAGGVAVRAFDALTRWPRGSDEGDADQLLAVFARWLLPHEGAEVYGEWAWLEPPGGWRELLTGPGTGGFTLGVQWAGASALREGDLVRVQAEVSNLEQSGPDGALADRSYYTSARVPQGYTQRGRVVGAAIGPGASSQWLAVDYLGPTWKIGATGGRIRWENDAFYRRPTGVSMLAHDVTVFGGVRATVRAMGVDASAELIRGKRFNYLFQNQGLGFGSRGATDVYNTTLRLLLSRAVDLPAMSR